MKDSGVGRAIFDDINLNLELVINCNKTLYKYIGNMILFDSNWFMIQYNSFKKFTLSYSAKIEPSKLFYHTDIYADKGKNHKDVYKGFNATYTISLTDNLGKSIFSKTLTKDNFKEIFDGSILTRTDSRLPNFIGYLNNFNSFLFTIDFWVPDSDVGGQCFFMINKIGDLTENSLNNYYVGADCDG